jgi:hypothetical protein
MALEKLVFDPLADRAFKWRPRIDAVQMAEGDLASVASEAVLLLENQEVEEGVSMTSTDGSTDG